MKFVCFLVLLFLIFSTSFGQVRTVHSNHPVCYSSDYSDSFKVYTGRYKLDDFNYLEVHYDQGELLLMPILWTSPQILEKIQEDSFVSQGHESLRYKFIRDHAGGIESVKLYGFQSESGQYQKLVGKREALELILNDKVNVGTQRLMQKHSKDTSDLVKIAEILNQRFCTKGVITRSYLVLLSNRFPGYAPIYAALGNSYALLGKNAQAVESFEKSIKFDPHNEESISSLQILGVNAYAKKRVDSSLKLPFDLSELFKTPKAGEINKVKQEWMARDLSARDVKIVDSGKLDLNGIETKVFIISHYIHGFKHYGAVILPEHSFKTKKSAILELKGVNPRYSPMDINNGLSSYRFLCKEADRFIYIVPSFRGEKLLFNGNQYLSEGDRTDVFDGATDDAISFLNAAVETFPQIDQDRITAFGKSRGGTVALLAGIRDKRIKYVLDWAGPVDWFKLMDQLGFTQEEFVNIGLINRSNPFQIGGQFIEWFLMKSIQGKEGLNAARNHIIASSPLYFLPLLPIVQAHYGIEDGNVPLRNGMAIQIELNKRTKKKNQEVFFHPNVGHDLNPMIAFGESRKFLIQRME